MNACLTIDGRTMRAIKVVIKLIGKIIEFRAAYFFFSWILKMLWNGVLVQL